MEIMNGMDGRTDMEVLGGMDHRSGEAVPEAAKATVRVRGLTIGAGAPKICVPVTAGDRVGLEKTLEELEKKRGFFDLAELRADFYSFSEKDGPAEYISMARDVLGDCPLLFTFRTGAEGGEREISFEDYAEVNLQAAEAGADLADLQFGMIKEEGTRGRQLLDEIHGKGCRVIGSFHDFRGTPPAEEIVRKLTDMQAAGFDITKTAVMPRDREDVLELLFASVQMKGSWADRPFVTMAMGPAGRISRVAGSFSGSAITFGTIRGESAPGQIPAEALRQILPHLS